MDQMEVDSRLTGVLIAALQARSNQGCISAFTEMLGRFIGGASHEEKMRALHQRRFIVDRRRPPPGQMGSTSFWECRWQYERDGALTVHARWCSSIPANPGTGSRRLPTDLPSPTQWERGDRPRSGRWERERDRQGPEQEADSALAEAISPALAPGRPACSA